MLFVLLSIIYRIDRTDYRTVRHTTVSKVRHARPIAKEFAILTGELRRSRRTARGSNAMRCGRNETVLSSFNAQPQSSSAQTMTGVSLSDLLS